MDVLDPELLTLFQVAQRPRVGELPPLRIALPLGGVELDARNPVALDQGLQVLQARLAVPGVPGPIEDEALGMAFLECAVLLRGVEAVLIEILEIRRLKDAHVDIAVDEDVLQHPLGTVLLEERRLPDVVRRTQVPMVVVETTNESGTILVGLVRRARIPQMHMPINDEQFLAGVSLEHGVPLSPGSEQAA
jgi:hypothetical protein